MFQPLRFAKRSRSDENGGPASTSTTARLLTDSFSRMIVFSTIIGALSGGAGMYVSYWLDVSSGATIVLLEAAVFAVVFASETFLHRKPSWTQRTIPNLGIDHAADDLG